MDRTDPQKVERYLEQRSSYDGGLEPEVERLLDSLEQWPRQAALQPRAGFLNEVAGELRQQSRSQEREAAGAVGRIKCLLAGAPARLAAGLAGAGLLVAAATLFALWFGSLRTVQEAETTPLSGTRSVAIGSGENYPEAPPSLPRYRIEVVPAPSTVEAMRAWAEAFGWPDARLYREQRNPETIEVTREDGARLLFGNPEYGRDYVVGYLRDRDREPALGPTLPAAEAVAIADVFLQEHHLSYEQAQARVLPSPLITGDGYPLRLVLVTPSLGGLALYSPVFSGAAGTSLFIDSSSEVYAAEIMKIDVAEAERVRILPADIVVEAFLKGDRKPLHEMVSLVPYRQRATYEASLPDHKLNERVTVLGTDAVRVLQPVSEDGQLQIELVTRAGAVYHLTGEELPEMATTVGDDALRVSGTIVAEMARGRWQLQVEEWEVVPRQSIGSGCVVGAVTTRGNAVQIQAQTGLGPVEPGAVYDIANAPPDLEDGQLLEVCADPFPAPGGDLPWTYIYTPPRTLDDYQEWRHNLEGADGTQRDQAPIENRVAPSTLSIAEAIEAKTLVVEQIELAYFVDPEGTTATGRVESRLASAVASPVWVVRGKTTPNGSAFIAYLDATATALPLADYPPRDTPYLVEGGDFWLAHTPDGEVFAFMPISPEYRDTVGVEECRYEWNAAVGRFVDPCSGDEWELDGRLNLEHSTELWSNRDLDRYETTVEDGVVTVHLDRVVPGASRGE